MELEISTSACPEVSQMEKQCCPSQYPSSPLTTPLTLDLRPHVKGDPVGSDKWGGGSDGMGQGERDKLQRPPLCVVIRRKNELQQVKIPEAR